MIEARVICDSVNAHGNRLTTMKLVYNKFIHGEFMTHRVFTRNASSSRAIPVAKLIAEVENPDTRAYPVYWPVEQKGMSGGDELSTDFNTTEGGYSPYALAHLEWDRAALYAVWQAKRLAGIGLHKSVINRILEPFSHIRVLVSATEYDNFFGLRLDRAAQPEMRTLAEAMWRVYGESKPKLLQPGEWHLPFVDDADHEMFADRKYWVSGILDLTFLIRVSVARCARTSYESFETGKRSTIEEDLGLYARLVGSKPLHASPTEHQATPDDKPGDGSYHTGIAWARPEQHGNFVGFRQYRKMLPGEAVAPLPEGYAR